MLDDRKYLLLIFFQQIFAVAVCLFGLAHASGLYTGVANYGGYGAGYGAGHGATSYVNRVDNIGYGGYSRGYAGYAHAPATSYVSRVDNNGYGAYNGAYNNLGYGYNGLGAYGGYGYGAYNNGGYGGYGYNNGW